MPFDIGSSEIHWAHCSQAAGISADINGGSCCQPPVWRWKGRNPSCKWVSVLGLCSGKLHECLNWKGAWFYTIMNTQALDKYWHQQCDRPTICLMPLGIKGLFSGAHDLINHPDEFVQVLFCTVSRGLRVVFFSLCLGRYSLTWSQLALAYWSRVGLLQVKVITSTVVPPSGFPGIGMPFNGIGWIWRPSVESW